MVHKGKYMIMNQEGSNNRPESDSQNLFPGVNLISPPKSFLISHYTCTVIANQ